jgi:hypothetical protein
MMMQRPIWAAISVLLVTFPAPSANAAELFVDAANTSGVEDGSSEWPFSTIAAGLEVATNGDTVTVEPGIYYGPITLKDDVRLVSSQGPGVTIIDGEGVNVVAVFAPYEDDPVDIHPDAYIDGFTIRNDGKHLMSIQNRYSFWSWSTWDIRNCVFDGDVTFAYQRAMYIYPGARTVIKNSVFRNLGHATDIIWAPTPIFINNTFHNVRSAFFVYQQPVVSINNTISDSYSAFHLWGSQSGGGWFNGARNNIFNVEEISVPVHLYSGEIRYPGLYLEDGFEVDPLFVDASAGNYQLQATSSLINAGVDPAAYSTLYPNSVGDYVKDIVINYVGDAPEIGAYEFGDQTVIGAVENLASSFQKVPTSDFKNPGEQRRDAISNKFRALLLLLGNYDDTVSDCDLEDVLTGARDKLVNDIWAKGDGFFGGNPNNDWITAQEEQDRLYEKVQSTLQIIDENLANLICN